MTSQNQYWTMIGTWALPAVLVRWPAALAFFIICPMLYGSDLLLIHGHIYTGNPRQQWASALAITGSRIDALGNNEEIRSHLGSKTRVIDLVLTCINQSKGAWVSLGEQLPWSIRTALPCRCRP